MPDEHSNLKTPAAANRPNSRSRGRRGGRGRGRGPRPPVGKSTGNAEEISPAPEISEMSDAAEIAETENTGGFREPHAETPADFASHEPEVAPITQSEIPSAPEPPREERREPRREFRREPRPPQRVAPAQRQWVRPADFRPAESSAIHEAVAHATFIAEALRQLHEQMDEILELVEVAERQKLADERELEELRRALRRIQPQHRPQPPRHQTRRDEPRPQPSPRENVQSHEENPPAEESAHD